MAADQPDDEAVTSPVAAAATPAQAAARRDAVARLRRRMAAAPLMTWPEPAGGGTAGDPLPADAAS
jgi:hypothetical protein